MSSVASAYRHLIRAAKHAFKGDETMLMGAMIEIRSRFEVGQEKLADAREAADFIRDFVVQSELDEGGRYRVAVEKHHVDSMQDVVIEHVDPGSMKVPKSS